MEVHFTPEQEAYLRLVKENTGFLFAVDRGLAAADRGEFIDEEEMDARVEQMLRR